MEVATSNSLPDLTKPVVNGVQPSGSNDEPHSKKQGLNNEPHSNKLGAIDEAHSNNQVDDDKGKPTAIQNGPLNLTKVDRDIIDSTSFTNVAGAIRMSASLGENHDLVETQKFVETNGDRLENQETADNVAPVAMESDSASSQTNDSNIPGTSQNNSSFIISATVDVEKLHIQPENIPRFSPATSADSTGDEASPCSDASSGTSTPVSKDSAGPSGILYKILTSKLQRKSVRKNSKIDSVPMLKTVPELPHRTPKVLMDPTAVKKTFKCRYCSRLFLKEYDFKQHERCHIQAAEKPFQCPQCGKRYQTNSKLVVHTRIHTGEQPYQCVKCKRRFMAAEYCKKHQVNCDGIKRRSQNINLLETPPNKKVSKVDGKSKRVKNSTAAAASSSRGTESQASDVEVFRCPNCYNKYTSKDNFLKHIKQHEHENAHRDKAVDGLFTCKKCGKAYEKKSNLDKHMMLHEGNAPHKCKQCGFVCLRKYNFKMHLDWHRKQKLAKKMGASYIKKFKCSVCMKGFQNAGHRAFHMKSHLVETEATQSSESEPVAAWPNVNDKMSYGSKFSANCPHCKKNFKRKFDLLRHIKTHSKNVKFTCKFCDSAFVTKTNYIKHIHLHTSGKYHYCRSCGLVYNKKVQKHRKEKLCWFKTSEAMIGLKGEKTSDSDELTMDYWDVMKPDPETCMWCNLTFNTKSNLYTHMRRHGTGHTCQWCGMVYKKEKQQHDPNFNCWLKTKEAVLKKEREKYQKTGTKPVDLLLGKGTMQKQEMEDDTEESTRRVDDKKMDLWRYECKYCDWAFVDSGNRATHQRRHEEGNHSCRWCGLVYLKRRQKHDRNSRCWLTTREGRLQIAKDNKSGILTQMKIKSGSPVGSASNNLPTTSRKSILSFQPQDLIKTDMTIENWQCDKCSKVFKSQPLLVNHMLLHSEAKPYPCPKCDRSFKLQANLARHLNNHSFQCTMCLKRFEKEAQMKKHMVKEPHNFSCNRCPRSFVRKISLKYHMLRGHGDDDKTQVQTTSREGSNNKLFCRQCGEGFDRTYSLAIHCRYTHSKSTPFVTEKDKFGLLICPKCGKKFRFKSQIERHMKSHVPKRHKCHLCGVMFGKLREYRKHMVKIHKETSMTCSKCLLTFTDEAEYNKHLDHHELNDKKEMNKSAEHRFSYTDQNSSEDGWSSEPGIPTDAKRKGGRPRKNQCFQCVTCKKQFKQRAHFLVHRSSCRDNASTSKWKTNKCRYCSMSFLNTTRLMTHMLNLHKQKMAQEPPSGSPEEELACHFCSRTYLSLYARNRHMRSAHPQDLDQMQTKRKQFECRYCGQVSKRLDFHVAHEKLHTNNVYKIQCKVCKIGFKCVEDLEEHGKAHAGFNKEAATQADFDGNVGMGHPIVANERPKKVIRPHVCRYCSLGFDKLTILERHEQTHSTESQPYSCRYCDMKFRRQAMLTKHEKLKHDDEEETESEGMKPKTLPMVRADDYKGMSPNFTCRGCHREFITQSGWEGHEKNCLLKRGRKPIVFESDTSVPEESTTEMPKVGTSSDSASESELLPEKSKTDKEIIHRCKKCKRKSSGYKNENADCDECHVAAEAWHAMDQDEHKQDGGEIKQQKSTADDEITVDERKQEDIIWKCSECESTFATRQAMETHMRFHTGKFPYKCSYCDEAFPRKDYLKRHERRDHGVEDELKVNGELDGSEDESSK